MPRVLRTEGIAIRHADGIVIRAAILAVIRRIRLVPGLGIQRAVGALGHVIDGQDIRVEEVAGVVGAVGLGVAVVVRGVGLAGGRALRHVVRPGEVLDAHVGIGGVDGAAEFDGAREVGLRRRRLVFDVA